MNFRFHRVALLLLSVVASHAWAGRPLGTDDAATADPGTCLLEGWNERTGSERSLVAGLACGIAQGFELGADYTHLQPGHEVRGESGLALKWVPESWSHDTAAGKLNLGLKFHLGFEHPVRHDWRNAEASVLGLATLMLNDEWMLHANLGPVRSRESHYTAGALSTAVMWTPHEQFFLFAELDANTHSQVFGGTVKTLGGRLWLVKDVFGLDLTASRESGSPATLWTLGFGWYGISF